MTESPIQTRFEGFLRRAIMTLAVLIAGSLCVAAIGTASAAADGTIVATKGGDRSASTSVSGATTYATAVSGSQFEYTTGNPTLPATVWTAFPAATNASGQASVTVAAGTYYVRERAAGGGFTNFGPVTNLSFNGPQPYVAKVTVANNQTSYTFPHTNSDGNPANWVPNNGGSASNNGSPFINVRDNATLPPGCGTNILLVLDRSGSIDPYKDEYEAAAKQFVSSLNGTPTQIGIVSFNDNVNSYQPAQGNASFYQSPLSLSNGGNAATLNGKIESIYDSPSSLTNWDGALQAAAQAKSFTADATTGQTTNPDMVVFITDGNPTTSEVSTSSSNEDLINLTSGMASANLVKNQTSRPGSKVKLFAIGVGNGVTIDNLKVVSGPVEGVNGDYAAPTIPELSAFLSELAASQCGARVYVRKSVTGQSGNQANWYYTATDPRPGKTPVYLDNNRATHSSGAPPVIETGAFFSQLPSTPTTVNVNEDPTGQPISNFELTSVDCRHGSYTGNPATGGVKNGLQFSLPVSRGDEIYCTYTNAPKTTLAVSKTPDNQFVNAGEDVEFTIQVSNTGSNQATGVSLADPLPPPGVGGWVISSQPGGNPCSIGGGTLNCSFGSLNAGQSVSVKVKTGTSYALCATYDNPSAQASAANAATVTDGGKVTCRKPNLTVTKIGNGPINAGQDVAFTITVGNTGPGIARSVTLSDPLPGGTGGPWVFASQPPGNPCLITGGNLTCNFGDLDVGQQVQVVVKAPTSNSACTVYNNLATAGALNGPSVQAGASVTCQKPSLGTLKTAVQASISAGDQAQFEITVSNGGPGTATAVNLSDPLPGGVAGPWTIVSQPAGDPCSITAGTLNCSFGDLPNGESRTVKVQAPTNFENCTELLNVATASSTNAPNASDDATIACDRPNLTVSKQGNGPIDAGQNVSFSVTTTNNGPGIARAVTLADPLPSGTAGSWSITAQPAGNPCSITAGTLNCSFGDLAAGDSRVVTVQAATNAASCGQYDNQATASATNSPNAVGQASVTCSKPSLSVTKSGNGPLNAGEDVSFTVNVTSGGPGTATNVSLSDPLPSGIVGNWSIVSQPAGNPCSIAAGTLSCSFGDLAAGQSRSVTVKAATSGSACGTYDNTATASAGNSPNAVGQASVECRKPSLTLTKSGNGTINAGENATFGITLANGGPGVAKAAALSDPLPSGTAGAWSITGQPAGNPCQISAGQLNCAFGDLPSGQSRTVTVSAPTSYEACGVYDNLATGSASNHVSVQDDASVTCQKPNLKIEKTGNGTINAGEDIEFSMTVSNSGPGQAKGVTLNDPLPTGVAGAWTISSQPAGDPCEVTADVLSCDFGDMNAGASAQVKVKAPTSHDACKLFENTATAAGEGLPEIQDNADVSCQKPNLGTLKTAVEASISAGDKAQFEITVTNTGPGVAKGVTLHDPLPSGVSGTWSISSQPQGNPCAVNGGVLECDFGDLTADESRTVRVEASTDFEQCSQLVNLATASADNAPDASDDAAINCNKPSLKISKSGNGPIDAGTDLQFLMEVSNTGPGVGKAVVLTDALPSGIAGSWSLVSTTQGSCQIIQGTLTCNLGDIQPNTTVKVTIKASTSAEQCGTYDNTATFTAGNSPNGSASATVECRKPALVVTKEGNGPVPAGKDVSFAISVANNGAGTAKSVKLNDPLPAGTANGWRITTQPGSGTCLIADRVLSCDFGDLAPGQAQSVRVASPTSPEKCASYENTAQATAANGAGAEGSASVKCEKPDPDLALRKSANKKKVFPGQTVKYRISVRNTQKGSVARDLLICDKLPAKMTVASRGEDSFFDKGRLCWRIDSLAYSEKWRTYTYTARVDDNVRAGQKLKNVVTMGNLKATKTVVVAQPVVSPARRVTPVTG